MAHMKDVTSGLHVTDAMVTELVTLNEGHTIDDAVEALLRTSQQEFPVLDDDRRVLGLLTREPMIRALRESGPRTPVPDVMQSCERTVHPGDNFDGAIDRELKRLNLERGEAVVIAMPAIVKRIFEDMVKNDRAWDLRQGRTTKK